MRHALLHRALAGSRARGPLTVVGIAVCTVLVLVLLGAYRSVRDAVSNYADQPPIDLWVAPRGADNLVRSSGLLAPEQVEDAEATEGAAASPILRAFVTVEAKIPRHPESRPLTLLAIGYRVPDGLGGPPRLSAGRHPRGPREAILDRAAAHRLETALGDEILVNGRTASIVGLSEGTNLLSTQLLFCDLDALQSATQLSKRASFLAVRAVRGDAAQLAARIDANTPGVVVYDARTFAANNAREVTAGVLPLIGLVTGLGVLVAAVLVALLVRTLVDDRRADLAVLLAMGASQAALSVAALRGVAAIVLAGAAAGSGSALALGAVLDRWAPTVPLAGTWTDVAAAAAMCFVCGEGAALVQLASLSQVDPLEAFRS